MIVLQVVDGITRVTDFVYDINDNFNELDTEKVDKANVLALDNTAIYNPTSYYHPATKKYVDTLVGAVPTGDMHKSVYDSDNDGIVDNSNRLGGQLPISYQLVIERGQANGYAPLDASGKINSVYLPTYVDEVVEFADVSSFPDPGETGVLYISIAENISYRWSGSVYVKIESGAVTSVFGRTGVVISSAGDYQTNQITESTLNYKFVSDAQRTILQVFETMGVIYDPIDETILFHGNIAATGGLLAYSDTGEIGSIFDNLPLATDNSGTSTQQGIANFDGTYFEVVDGYVTLIGSTSESFNLAADYNPTGQWTFTLAPKVGTNAVYHSGNFIAGTDYLAYRTFGTAANSAIGDFATAAQGTLATNAEPKITAGNTSQYWRGDKTWQTLPIASAQEYPLTAGITIKAEGYGWGTSIVDNSSNWNTAYSNNLKWNGQLSGLVASTGRTSLGGTTVGQNIFTSPNPSNPTFLKANLDNTVSWLSSIDFITAIGAASSTHNHTGVYEPVISAGTTAQYWRGDKTWQTLPTTSTDYPETAGIVVKSEAFGWGTSITDNSSNWNTAYTDRFKWDGGSTGLVAATGRTSLGGTNIGQQIFTMSNPNEFAFLKADFNNDVTWVASDNMLATIGYTGALNANYITDNTQIGNGRGYVTSSGNTIIGTDTDINTSGSTIIDNIYVTDGVITSMGTRVLTIADIGAAASSHTHDYLPLSGGILSGNIGRSAHNNGFLVGGYNNVSADSTATCPIYAMGTDFLPLTTSLSNMYGIGYTNSAASFINSTDLGTDPSGWGMYVAADGNARIFLEASAGNIRAKGNMYASNFSLSSDARLKTNVLPLDPSLAYKLRPITHDWIDGRDCGYSLGFIAQEVQKVSPELVFGTETLGIVYSKITAINNAAIQDLNLRVITNKSETDILKERLSIAEKKIVELESKLN